jgi:hypothetical protein
VPPQVDDPADAVTDERRPTDITQLSDAIGTNDRTAASRPTIASGQSSEIADVDAALPTEGAPVIRQSHHVTLCPRRRTVRTYVRNPMNERRRFGVGLCTQDTGAPEEALDCECGLYLGDISAWRIGRR